MEFPATVEVITHESTKTYMDQANAVHGLQTDTMPTRDLPIMDKNNGGTAVGYSATIAKAAGVSGVDTIINGHNATTTTPADLKRYSAFIADFVKFAQDAKKSGKTVDDVTISWKALAFDETR